METDRHLEVSSYTVSTSSTNTPPVLLAELASDDTGCSSVLYYLTSIELNILTGRCSHETSHISVMIVTRHSLPNKHWSNIRATRTTVSNVVTVTMFSSLPKRATSTKQISIPISAMIVTGHSTLHLHWSNTGGTSILLSNAMIVTAHSTLCLHWSNTSGTSILSNAMIVTGHSTLRLHWSNTSGTSILLSNAITAITSLGLLKPANNMKVLFIRHTNAMNVAKRFRPQTHWGSTSGTSILPFNVATVAVFSDLSWSVPRTKQSLMLRMDARNVAAHSFLLVR